MGAISGIFHFDPDHQVERATLERMSDAVRHRGPEHSGLWMGVRVGFAQRPTPPVTNDAQSIVIVFSGQLFNRQAIRRELESAGVRLRTGLDADLVLRMYEAYGESCAGRLNGQFAFAIWDARESSIFLVRDALGICPLHYAITDDALIFSSEAKGVLAHPGVRAASDDRSLVEALLCGAVFENRSMFAGVRSLEPGSTITVTPSAQRTSTYWRIPRETSPVEVPDGPFEVAELRDLVEDAIRLRITDTERWGILLSGGIDSSALTTWAQKLSPEPVHTFSIDFATTWKGIETDSYYSALVAGRLGTEHLSFALDSEEYFTVLEDLTWHVERPYNKAAATMHLMAQRVAPHAQVALSGEGMDEMLAGYVGARGLGLDDELSSDIQYFPWAPGPETVIGLLADDFRAEIRAGELFEARLADALAEIPSLDPLNRKLYLYTTYFLRELVALHEQGAMAVGVETRFPYLDHRLVQLLVSLPSPFKFRDGQTKAIFRQLIQDVVPPEVLARRKTHLPMPHDPAAIARQLELARDLLCDPGAQTARYFDRRRLAQFLSKRATGSADMLTVWQVSMNLITLELLHRRFSL